MRLQMIKVKNTWHWGQLRINLQVQHIQVDSKPISPSVKSTVQNTGNIDTAKTFANELVTCIDTATEGVKLSSSTTDIAASFMALMGWLK